MKNTKINKLIKDGYFKFKLNEKLFSNNLIILKNIISKKIKSKYTLENFHNYCTVNNLNDLRLYVFKEINKNKNSNQTCLIHQKKMLNYVLE